jgi:glutathione S-transferase
VTPASPYVRVVRMAIEERGLAERVEVLAVPTRVPDSPVNALVPTGKVPTLVTGDGHALSESRLICQHLDRLHDGAPVVDPDPATAARALEGVVTGFLDGVSVWVRELRRPPGERSPGILEQERARAWRCVTWLESRIDDVGEGVDYPRLCLGAALYVLDERVGLDGWREAAPRLAAWFDRFRARASYRATAPAP